MNWREWVRKIKEGEEVDKRKRECMKGESEWGFREASKGA